MAVLDRLTICRRPESTPVMLQCWRSLLFLHWRVDPARLRPLLPRGLELDLFDGEAWVGVTPFTITGIRPPHLPALPLVSRTHEINVRTYVAHEGVPGVWFFSLDASSPLAVAGARLAFALPYFNARMTLERAGDEVRFHSRRRGAGERRPEFAGGWTVGAAQPAATEASLTFFLTERYCLYTTRGEAIYRARIHHRPWSLHDATAYLDRMTMLTHQGIPHEDHPPVLHAQGAPLDVEIWRLERVGPVRG